RISPCLYHVLWSNPPCDHLCELISSSSPFSVFVRTSMWIFRYPHSGHYCCLRDFFSALAADVDFPVHVYIRWPLHMLFVVASRTLEPPVTLIALHELR